MKIVLKLVTRNLYSSRKPSGTVTNGTDAGDTSTPGYKLESNATRLSGLVRFQKFQSIIPPAVYATRSHCRGASAIMVAYKRPKRQVLPFVAS